MLSMLSRQDVPATTFTRYLYANGLIYFGSGLLFVVWPYAMELAGTPKLTEIEAGYLRCVGLCVMQIASFYLFGMRTKWPGFGLASLFNRLLAPVQILPLVFLGLLEPMLGVPFSIVDFLLASIGLAIWRRNENRTNWLLILFGPAAGPPTTLSQFIRVMGVIFLAVGILFYFIPSWLLTIQHVSDLLPHELGYLRAIGIAIIQIGWFYTMGSKTRSDHFALWSILIRAGSALTLITLLSTGLLRAELGMPLVGLDLILLTVGLGIFRSSHLQTT